MIIKAFSKTIVRLPSFPFSFLKNILEMNNDHWVKLLLSNDIFIQGILISSPEFHHQVANYESCIDHSKKERIRLTLLKYLIRSSTRCIPFGLFSGLGVLDNDINSDESGVIKITDMKHFNRLDSGYSSFLIDQINSINSVRQHLNYFVNTTLYEKSEKFRYVDYILQNDSTRKYDLVQIKKNKYLKQIFDRAKDGLKFDNLTNLLVEQGFETNDSINYIHQLIDNQILVSELEPGTIGISSEEKCLEILKRIIDEDDNIDTVEPLFELFSKLNEKLKRINAISPLTSYKDSILFQEFLKKEINNADHKIFHSDLYFSANGNLSSKQQKLVHKGIKVFNSLISFTKKEGRTRLDLFKDEFFNRYEYQSVSLVDVLDIESGIGYDLTLKSFGIEDDFLTNNFPNHNDEDYNRSISWNVLDSLLVRKIEKCNYSFCNTLEINETDLQKIDNLKNENYNSISSTGCVRFSLFEDENKHEIIFIDSISKSSPNKVLGRFSTGNKEIEDLVNEISSFENQYFCSDTIIAEIDHLPFSKFGNILNRSNIRKYVISYHGGVSSKNNYFIPISDLYISYREDKIILFSKTLKKNIIPFFSNAFNDDMPNVLPVFKFLFDLHYQYEDMQNGYFDVNKYLDFFKHIPRIKYGNIILTKETWIIHKEDFIDKGYSLDQIIVDFKQNCNKLKLPNIFTIINGDMELLIDSNNLDTIKIFISELKKYNSLILKEFLMLSLNSVVVKDDSHLQFNNEFFLPFKNDTTLKKIGVIPSERKKQNVKRSFPIGSEWMYFKIYSGVNMADKILVSIEDKLASLVQKKIIKEYFFIKYKDPDYHIRLRLLLFSVDYFDIVFREINEYLKIYLLDKKINNLVLDSYQRELERYDYSNIVFFEKIFYYDSKLVIDILKKYKLSKTSQTKWFYSLTVIDIYCSVIGFSENEKLSFCEKVKNDFSVEFKSNSQTSKFINEKYLFYKNDLLEFFENYENDDLEFDFKIFQDEILLEFSKYYNLTFEKKVKYLQSIIHMHVIRLLGAQNNRLYEFIIYDFYLKILKQKHFKNISKMSI